MSLRARRAASRPEAARDQSEGAPQRSAAWLGRSAWAVTAVAFALYLATMAPSITNAYGGSDSGELASVASVLGVAHGPGYGLYMLLARGAQLALGFLDEPAFRTNVLSAVFSALAAGVLVRVAGRGLLGTSWWAAGTGGLVLAVASVVWEQAILTEVYALHVLLAVCALFAVLRYIDGAGSLAVAGLALGGLVAHHPSGLMVAAPLGVVVLTRRPEMRALVAAVALSTVPLLASIAYLVLRADAPIGWGHTGSAAGIWHALSGADYRGFWLSSPSEFVRTFPASLRLALLQLPPPLWPLALLGVGEAWRVRRPLLIAMGVTALVLVVVVTMYRADGREPYLSPVAASLALLAAWGVAPALAVLREWFDGASAASGTSRASTFVVGALLLAGAVWVGVDAVRAGRSLRGDRSAEEQPLALLTSAAPDATIRVSKEEVTFALWYLRTMRGLRPDVTIIDTRGLAPVIGPGR